MELNLWNRNKEDLRQAPQFFGEASRFFYFETCLRRLWIQQGERHECDTPADFSGYDAYQFLLSVLCGLESPFLGETEVFGQFREQSRRAPEQFQTLFQTLFRDVKSVRTSSLVNFGPSSYGGIARLLLAKSKKVVLLGAGSLGQEILPWLKEEGREILWMARQTRVLNNHTVLAWNPELLHSGIDLILAAPISDFQLGILQPLNRVLDFRAEHRFEGACQRLWDFSALQEVARANQDLQRHQAFKAQEQISEMIEVKRNEVKARPLGWEDLCTYG